MHTLIKSLFQKKCKQFAYALINQYLCTCRAKGKTENVKKRFDIQSLFGYLINSSKDIFQSLNKSCIGIFSSLKDIKLLLLRYTILNFEQEMHRLLRFAQADKVMHRRETIFLKELNFTLLKSIAGIRDFQTKRSRMSGSSLILVPMHQPRNTYALINQYIGKRYL